MAITSFKNVDDYKYSMGDVIFRKRGSMKKKINCDDLKKMEPLKSPLTLEEATKEAARCLLCDDAPCSKGAPQIQIREDLFVRSGSPTLRARQGLSGTINVLGEVCAYTCPTEKLSRRGVHIPKWAMR
jgi:Fe-S-cluster-containing hydrogenase component 2